ncbi:conserved hypothetical protein [Desulfarculus baarsii DSM 2075]|uniref:Uncharacterized protein n=1 Tax=Desulfarculus baarsii (strain ATCC 33931 / DSM 2075 / LMG 7858 / VKM B-1802 / 2st14) TaxID=644282 RepID=E1QI28_DESB2|nr:hypothetical protein [Desulfarculus baarsii]ADK85221.1 conserved hypothetical protein [Desulfarculus baarsii DSM 2075]
MSDLINFPGEPRAVAADNVIADKPMRLRWGDWRTHKVLQAHVGAAAAYEDQRREFLSRGQSPAAQMPPGFELDGGEKDTALALLRFRGDEGKQRRLMLLAVLTEALISVPCAILRTDLIRRVYQQVGELSRELGHRWSGDCQRLLPPLNEDAHEPDFLAKALINIDNLREFFDTATRIADERYQKMAKSYVFYYPRGFSA